MKINRTVFWVLTGISAFALALVAVKMFDFGMHGGGRHLPYGYGRGPHRPHVVPHASYPGPFYVFPVAMLLLKVALLSVGSVLWMKAAGLLKWIGAGLAVLSLMSLLTPLWGALVILLIIVVNRRLNKTNPSAAGSAYEASWQQMPPAYNRGRFLDEWEHNQSKEDK